MKRHKVRKSGDFEKPSDEEDRFEGKIEEDDFSNYLSSVISENGKTPYERRVIYWCERLGGATIAEIANRMKEKDREHLHNVLVDLRGRGLVFVLAAGRPYRGSQRYHWFAA